VADSASSLFKTVLWQSALLVAAIAVISSIAGGSIAGAPGVNSALIGSAVALVFTGLTVFSVWFGARLPLAGFYGLVLGGWLIKLVLFGILMVFLLRADFIHGPTFFFVVVAAVLGGLAIDSVAVLKNRIPIVGDESKG
jgi:hypothetical protein